MILAAIAEAQQAQGQGAEAIASFREALSIFEADPGPESATTGACFEQAWLVVAVSRCVPGGGTADANSAENPREALWRAATSGRSSHFGNLGLLYFRLGDYGEAEKQRCAAPSKFWMAYLPRRMLTCTVLRTSAALLVPSMPHKGNSAKRKICYNERSLTQRSSLEKIPSRSPEAMATLGEGV